MEVEYDQICWCLFCKWELKKEVVGDGTYPNIHCIMSEPRWETDGKSALKLYTHERVQSNIDDLG